MIFERHVEVTKIVFGEGYPEVHKWIDACFPKYMHDGECAHYGSVNYHWIERHHIEALAEEYGENSVRFLVGCLHIVTDWINHWGIAKLPRNQSEVKDLIDEQLKR